MLIIGFILSMFGVGLFCWLIFTLAVYALPFFVGLTAAMAADRWRPRGTIRMMRPASYGIFRPRRHAGNRTDRSSPWPAAIAGCEALVSLRLDPSVLAGLRATGPGWQTRANTVLKNWLARRRLSQIDRTPLGAQPQTNARLIRRGVICRCPTPTRWRQADRHRIVTSRP